MLSKFLHRCLHFFTLKHPKASTRFKISHPSSIVDLDDQILALIFDWLPLTDLVQLHHVTPHWLTAQIKACSHRRILSLEIGTNTTMVGFINKHTFEIPYYYEESCSGLELNSLDSKTAYWLISTFPHVCDLSLVIKGVSDSVVEQLILLFKYWGQLLVKLSLSCHYELPSSKVQIESNAVSMWRLLSAIDSDLVSLTHLSLICACSILPEPYNQSRVLDLPLLRRITHFQFHSHDPADIMMHSVQRYAKLSPTLGSISLGNTIKCEEMILDQFLSVEATLAARFVDVTLEYRSTNVEQLIDFCWLYSSLTTLRLTVGSQPLGQLVYCLAPLTRLVYLRLNIDICCISNLCIPLASLPSVRILSLSLITRSHVDLSKLQLVSIFPNLTTLELWNNGHQCSVCGYENSDDVTKEQSHECVRQLLQPLKGYAQLSRICTKRPQKWEWSVGDL